MEKRFKSKVDNWFIFIAILSVVICLIFGFNQNDFNSAITSIAISIIILVFFVYTYFNTFYTIKNNKLLIKNSFILNQTIEIQQIKKIVKSNSWESAPALSMDRLEIMFNEKPAVRYNFYDNVIISPENNEEFIKNLLEINPKIEVNLK